MMIKESVRTILLISLILLGLVSIIGTGGGSGGDERDDGGSFSYSGDDDEEVAGYPELWDTLPSCREMVNNCVSEDFQCSLDCDWNDQSCIDGCDDGYDRCIAIGGGDPRGIPYVEVDWCDPRGL